MERSASPSPTTVSPITLPAENAARSARFKPLLAAVAVRPLAAVAIFMPKNPESPEKNPPVKKAKGKNFPTKPVRARMPSTANIQAKNTATTRYCRLRKAFAPLRMIAAIPCASASSLMRRTLRAKNSAKPSASTAAQGAIRTAYSIDSPFKSRFLRRNAPKKRFFL